MKEIKRYLHKHGAVISLLCVVFIVFGSATLAVAAPAVRPANPQMDYVPQNVGIYDTYYSNFREPDCRVCHGSSTAERHHGTEYALSSNCLHCHFTIPSEPERDCKACHVDGGPIGDLGYPHHKSDSADSGRCNDCHDPNLIVEYNTVVPPGYEPSTITPTPYSCENCHWPSGKVPDEASVYLNPTPPPTFVSNFVKFKTDWNSWGGRPKPSYVVDPLDPNYGNTDPQPIEPNGQANFYVSKHPYRPYIPSWGTHHDVDGKVRPKCWNCHGQAPVIDPDNPLNIRYCEACHSVGTLHAISEHVNTNYIYTVGGKLNQTVTANMKCDGCHGDNLPELPPQPAVAPVITDIEPNFGPPDMVVTLYADPTKPFGPKQDGDRVKMGQGSPVSWVEVPIYYWVSGDFIQIRIPEWYFYPGNTKVKVFKTSTPDSTITNFTIREHPEIYSLNPSSGTYGVSVQVNGNGFGVKQEIINPDGYGYSTYVELHASNDIYRVTKYPIGLKTVGPTWAQNQITIKLRKLLDTETMKEVPSEQLYQGCWNVKVITDYFKDDGDKVYNLGMKGFDLPGNANHTGTGDTLLYREIGDPVCYTVTATPFITCVRPFKVRRGNYATITGASFGPTKSTSYVRLGPASARVEISSDGIGDDDGICEAGEACTLDPLNPAVKIVTTYSLWSNTSIKFKVPGPTGYRWVQVVVPGAAPATTYSNLYRIKVIP